MVLRAKVLGLTRYRAKGVPGEAVQCARFLAGLGMEGDFYARGGERQVSLLSLEERQWMNARAEQGFPPGLCFGRYKENILFDAGLSLVPGAGIAVGEAALEVSAGGKRCFSQCHLSGKGQPCILAGRNLFAKVVRGGLVRAGDYAQVEEVPA
ncbi:MAG: hypothetical protein FWD88_06485 [Treponema sp.]|nr:hypothetical protein [Treponema sp.]